MRCADRQQRLCYDKNDTATGAIGIYATGAVAVNGGYLDIATTRGTAISCTSTYFQTGGYVKAISSKSTSLHASSLATVSGGYLEASGYEYGVVGGGGFTNSGGVVKATATAAPLTPADSFSGIWAQGDGAGFSGGVTIANSNVNAIKAAGADKIRGDELYWVSVAGVVSGDGTAVSSLTGKAVVIAKKACSTQIIDADVDGVYVKVADSVAWKPSGPVTVGGGSYIEGVRFGLLLEEEADIDIDGTLVCKSTGDFGEGLSTKGRVIMGEDATLYGEYTGADEIGGIAASEDIVGAAEIGGYDVIGVTSGSGCAIFAPLGSEDNPITGCVIGVNNGDAGSACGASIYVGNGGSITAVAKGGSAVEIQNDEIVAITGTGAITAVGATAYSGPAANSAETTGVKVTGAAAYSPLTATTYDGDTYKVGDDTAKVVCITRALPTVGEMPVIDSSTAPAIFANGNEIMIVAGTTSGCTNILYDLNGDGEIGDGEFYEAEYMKIGDEDPSDEGYDLSNYTVVGGCKDETYTDDTRIIMTGGVVECVVGGSHSTGEALCSVGYTDVEISG